MDKKEVGKMGDRWYYVDGTSEDDVRKTVESDGYKVRRIERIGPLSTTHREGDLRQTSLTQFRFKVYVTEGRGV